LQKSPIKQTIYIYISICIYMYRVLLMLYVGLCTHTRTHTHTHTHTHILREKDICVQLLNLRLRKLGKRIGGCDRRNQLWRRAPVVNTYTPTPTEPPTVKLAPNNPQPPASIPTHIHTWWHYWKGECVPLQHLVHKSSSRVFVERGQEQKV